MVQSIIKVEGMACEHCVTSVTNAVSSIDGVSHVSVNLKSKSVTVDYDPTIAALAKIKSEIEDIGYDVAS